MQRNAKAIAFRGTDPALFDGASGPGTRGTSRNRRRRTAAADPLCSPLRLRACQVGCAPAAPQIVCF